MAFTYVGDLSTDLDKVRFYSGDTSATAQVYLTDEEIAGILDAEDNIFRAAAMSCRSRAGRWAEYVDTANTGGLSVSASQRMENLLKLAEDLRLQASQDALNKIGIEVGGVEISELEDLADDTTYRKPRFSIGKHDNDYVDDDGSIDRYR